MGFIYKIWNDNNNKIYIGQTSISVKNRWSHHLYDYIKYDTPLYRAMKKYGAASFHIETIEECNDENLNDREIYWIQYYNSYISGYNATPGGTSVQSGNMNKLIDDKKIKQLWDEGYSISDIKNMLQCAKITVQDHLKDYENYSIEEAILRGKTSSSLKRGREILQYDLNNNFIQSFPSIKVAAEKCQLQPANIRKCANGERKRCGNYKWKYANNNIKNKKQTKIYQYDLQHHLINIFNNKLEASKATGCDNSGISKVCNGKAKTCGGYIWEEKEILEE